MMRRILSLLCIIGSAAACMPNLQRPVVNPPAAYRYAEAMNQDTLSIAPRWWELFGDTTLNRLIERALANNRDLWTTAARVEEARENLRITRATYLPELDFEVGASATYNDATKITQRYTVEPTLSWEISLFGALRKTTEASRAAIASAVWNYRGMALSVAAEVATTYFTLLQYERDLMIATRTYALRRESAALIDSLFHYGMSSGIDREQALSQLYAAEVDIPRYRSAIEQTALSLNLLLGDTPKDYGQWGIGSELLTDQQPESLAVGIPSELLQRRPDIIASFYDLQQAAATVGVRRAARFPAVTLTAQGGIGGNSIGDLSASNPAIWSAAGSLVEPLFAFGKLRSAERAAIEAYNAAAATYEQTVLAAFIDVEKALSTIRSAKIETERYAELVTSYQRIDEMAHALYRNGMVDYLDVIDAERTLYTAQMQYVNLLAQQYINYVSLCKALGGGWR